jgi:hypothetical protein
VLSKNFALTLIFCCAGARIAVCGDAVAIAYNSDGAWSALTYNRSSTPRGGPHYRDSHRAAEFAVRDLWKRATEYLDHAEVLGQSDKTGYVSVARGKSVTRNKDVVAVGRGKSQSEADAKALTKLRDRDATTEAQTVYQYFSYGTDSGAKHARNKKRVAAVR